MKVAGKVDICGVLYEVLSATDKEDEILEGAYGYADHFNQRIVIDKDARVDTRVETLLHEGQHGIWSKSGLRSFVSRELKTNFNSKRIDRFEETFIRIHNPHLVRFLQSAQKIKL